MRTDRQPVLHSRARGASSAVLLIIAAVILVLAGGWLIRLATSLLWMVINAGVLVLIFLVILMIGLAYAWRKGALEWA